MDDLSQYIRNYFGIPQEKLAEVAKLFHREELAASDHFVRQGQHCNKLSFISKGIMRVYASAGDKEITQWVSTEGYFMTDLSSFIFDTAARWNIEALSDCELYSIRKDQYDQIKEVVPEWDQLEKLFIAKCFLTLEDRVFQFLSLSAEERYDQLYSTNKELFQKVPQKQLASMLGMTPETFSRIRKSKIS